MNILTELLLNMALASVPDRLPYNGAQVGWATQRLSANAPISRPSTATITMLRWPGVNPDIIPLALPRTWSVRELTAAFS